MSDFIFQTALSSLEIEFILNEIKSEIRTEYGYYYLEQIKFYKDKDVVIALLNETSEAKDAILFDDPVPIYHLKNIKPILETIEPEESFLEIESFLELLKHFEVFAQTRDYFVKRKEKYSALYHYAFGIKSFDSVAQEIKRVVNPKGEIYDNASPKLKEIRSEIRHLENQIKTQLNKLLTRYKEFVQDEIVTLRDGRYVLPIQDIHYHKVPGIVHGMSSSGKTYFVEPLEVLQISNNLQDLRLQERKEIIAILRRLTDLIREIKTDILYSIENIAYIDFVLAKAAYAIKIQASKPIITDKQYFSIQNARHPILISKIGFDNVIPLKVFLGDYYKILIITGPNAGGKTVALKTIGLVIAMTQMGILPPVEEGTEVSIVPAIYVDIGDKQSIEQDLSTFSSHITGLKNIIEHAPPGSLVLLDELGTATDPEQGAALSMAILDYLLENNMFAIATTHLGQLKMYAAEKDSVENASMEFDKDHLEPRYALRIGVPGASYAFEIARRFGLQESIIDKARKYLGEEKLSVEKLLIELNEKIQSYQEKIQEVSVRESEVNALKKLLERRKTAIQEEKQKIRKEALEEMQEYLRKTRVELENTIRELKKKGLKKELAQKARKQIEEADQQVEKELVQLEEKEEHLTEVQVGQFVKLKGLNRIGEVVTEPNEKGKLWVDFDGLKMQVQLQQLTVPEESEIIKIQTSKNTSISHSPSFQKVGRELDVRGMDVQEAIDQTNEYLTNAINSGWDEVLIIHGKGKGILRREINNFLARDKRVLEKRFGNWGEGDTGVTIVKLRKE